MNGPAQSKDSTRVIEREENMQLSKLFAGDFDEVGYGDRQKRKVVGTRRTRGP